MANVKLVILALLLSSGAALAQSTPSDWSPPPMVPTSPPPMPPVDAPTAQPTPTGTAAGTVGTPPPPGASSPSYIPGQQRPSSGYPYSPYGARPVEKPGPEVGLMITESLFGMLTSAGVSLLPYFLLFNGGMSFGDPTITSVIFLLIFSAVPLGVASTETSLANGSRYYYSEQWPAALSGFLAMAGVLGIYYLTGWLPMASQVSGGTPRAGGNTAVLLAGSVIAVPLIEMIAINVFKTPKPGFAGLSGNPKDGYRVGVPMVAPLLAQTASGPTLGVNLSLVNVRF